MASCALWESTCWARVRPSGMSALQSHFYDLHKRLGIPPVKNDQLTNFSLHSLFMSIGSVIRTEGPHNDAWLRARGPPMMLPRQSPFRPMRQ